MIRFTALASVFLSACATAQTSPAEDPFAGISTYERSAYSRDVTSCDELAGHPSDPEAVTTGVAREAMDKPAAIEACLIALESDPGNPRLNYQLARAYGYSGLHEAADPYRDKALQSGYPQSLFVLGYIRLEGWDGRPPEPCYGGELVRRSAEAGRFAGLIGFPHYVRMGRFETCGSYPVIDPDQIAVFLTQAEARDHDYYQGLLIESLKAHFGIEGE